MKFLSKNEDSSILKQGLTYKENSPGNNKRLKELLIDEQKNFCAYTEKYMQELDSCEVEHFNSALKYKDDYYNYYAVLRSANLYKQDEKYVNASFFQGLFFQNKEAFDARIRYVKGGDYEAINEQDQEADELIDFLGFNHPTLYNQRSNHFRRLINTFLDAKYNPIDILNYFRNHREELSFITALEIEIGVDLSEFYS